MFLKKYVWHVMKYSKSWERNFLTPIIITNTRMVNYCNKGNKNNLPSTSLNFESVKVKNRNTYLEMVQIFTSRDINRRGHVEFIYSALKNMENFGVHKDLQVYKALLDVLPKGKFIPRNLIQSEFMHYPKQQQCAIDLLEQMEDNGVMPDHEVEDILLNVFGKRGYPLRKFWRIMYWMPKFKNMSPWAVPNPPPNDALELAKLAISRINSVDLQAEISIYQTSDISESIDDTWIVSSQSPKQVDLLKSHNLQDPIYIEGPFIVWLRTQSVNYYLLKTLPKPLEELPVHDSDDVSHISVPLLNLIPPKSELYVVPSVHEQSDGVILALCATGTSSKDSLLSWIRHLEKSNPVLNDCQIVFSLKEPEKEIATATEDQKTIPDN